MQSYVPWEWGWHVGAAWALNPTPIVAIKGQTTALITRSGTVNVTLMRLEMKRLIRAMSGRRYVRLV